MDREINNEKYEHIDIRSDLFDHGEKLWDRVKSYGRFLDENPNLTREEARELYSDFEAEMKLQTIQENQHGN